jgi:hypothetical protein
MQVALLFVLLQDLGYNGSSEGNTIPLRTIMFIASNGERGGEKCELE